MYGSTSKPDAKKKRRHDNSSNRMSSEAMKNYDGKIEELRKASMNEINRLEAKMENEDNEKAGRFTTFEEEINHRLNDMMMRNNEQQKNINQLNGVVGKLLENMKTA